MASNDRATINPCHKEEQHAFKCLIQNDYDKDQCTLFLDNYKVCKDFWYSVEKDRRRKGIKPYKPSFEERNRIKETYKKTGRLEY